MKFQTYLIKYGEIGIKGKNRYLFEDALVKQIHHRLKRLEGGFTVTKEAGRIYAEASEAFDFDEVVNARLLSEEYKEDGIHVTAYVPVELFEELYR